MTITDPTRLEIALTLFASRFVRGLIYKPFVERIGLKGDERVLDFGAGWGDVTFFVAPLLGKGGSVTLLDISSGWQRVAKKRLNDIKNISFVNADIFSAGLPDQSFDVIVIHFMLHDIPTEERQAIVKELAKKLKPGGFVYLGEPTTKSHGMTSAEIDRLMSDAGLRRTYSKDQRKQYEARFLK